MSLTARERHNPPPRRKSCAACIKAKRRCDFAVPACLRCSQRRIACQYPNRPPREQSCSTPQTPDLMQGMLTADALTPATLGGGADDFNTVVASIDSDFNDLTSFELPLDDATLDLIHQPSMLAPPASKGFELSQAITLRLQWAIDEMRRAPTTMVLEMQTPWSHSCLYKDEMPRSMQDAHAACALYLAKNRVNAPVIFRSIESRVQDLLAAPDPVAPRDCLAHTQALLLYSIIRLFDGDIAARASAERTIPALESSALSLLTHVTFDIEGTGAKELPLFPLAPTKAFWSEWIFQESTRRTLLITFFFAQAYRILSGVRGLQCDGRLGLCHAWTLSSYLWHARTSVAFAEAWKMKKHFVITNADFEEVLDKAMAEDIDSFGRIFISSYMGIEEAEGWFLSRGGKL
ncbi:Fc.00g037960.m01.CDS01 [Cosmosporella sp. VM-42]